MFAPKLNQQWQGWALDFSRPLHRRLAWRLPPIVLGILLASGRRTASSWWRAISVGTSFGSYYYFLGSIGRKAKPVAAALLKIVGCASGFWRPVPFGRRTGDRIEPATEDCMNPATLDAMTPLQRTIVERSLALAKELEATAGSAPAGQIIDRCESLLLGNGREFLRLALEDTLQARVDALEKKGQPAGSAPVA